MWNIADVVHFKVQSWNLSKGAKDHEISVRIARDCVNIWTEERIDLKRDCWTLDCEAG